MVYANRSPFTTSRSDIEAGNYSNIQHQVSGRSNILNTTEHSLTVYGNSLPRVFSTDHDSLVPWTANPYASFRCQAFSENLVDSVEDETLTTPLSIEVASSRDNSEFFEQMESPSPSLDAIQTSKENSQSEHVIDR